MTERPPLPSIESLPTDLTESRRWVLWRFEPRGDKVTKVPVDAQGRRIDATNPGSWLSLQEALRIARAQNLGVGFCVGEGVVGIDLDHAVDPVSGDILPWAKPLLEAFRQAAYIELSPSGTGAHFLLRGAIALPRNRYPLTNGMIEVYSHGRFLTITGRVLRGCTRMADASAALAQLPQLIEVARIIAEVAASHADLWAGAWESAYPSQSEADLVLCRAIARYTRDPRLIDRVFRYSGLFRPKWDERRGAQTYGELTIAKVLEKGPPARPAREGWALPRELPPAHSLPPMPPELVPAPLRDWLEDLAARRCVPLEMVAVPAVVVAGAAIGRALAIRPEPLDRYALPANLWGAIVAPPGMMKSSLLNEITRPLRELDLQGFEDYENEAFARAAKIEALDAQIAAIKAQLREGDQEALRARLELLLAERADIQREPRRRVVNDSTVEKLAVMLAQNPRGLLLLRDELVGWLRLMDKPGREGDRQLYLEAWEGTGSFTMDRVVRGTLRVPALTLSVLGGLQPGPLRRYVREAVEEGGADGLLARLQLLVWPDGLPPWQPREAPPDPELHERVRQIFQRLDQLDPLEVHAVLVEEQSYLCFDHDAQQLYREWRAELEGRLRGADDLPEPLAIHLSKYRGLMPKLALVFHLLDRVDGRCAGGPVSLAATRLAAAWCGYLELHAAKLYGLLEQEVPAAHVLAARIREGLVPDGCSVREIYRRQWRGLVTPEAVRGALDILESCGWIRVERLSEGHGRPREVIRINPLITKPADKTDKNPEAGVVPGVAAV